MSNDSSDTVSKQAVVMGLLLYHPSTKVGSRFILGVWLAQTSARPIFCALGLSWVLIRIHPLRNSGVPLYRSCDIRELKTTRKSYLIGKYPDSGFSVTA